MRFLLSSILTVLLSCGCSGFAQEQSALQKSINDQAPLSYKLAFSVRDFTNGKVLSNKVYQTVITTDAHGGLGNSSIRAGNRVPIPTGPPHASSISNSLSTSQYQYSDVGVNIDCKIGKPGEPLKANLVRLFVSAEVSSFAPPEHPDELNVPLTREDKWSAEFLLSLGKPTLLFSSDDPHADHTTQIELTAVQLP